MRWIEAAAVHLRTAIVNLENIFDPKPSCSAESFRSRCSTRSSSKIAPLPRSVSSRREDGWPRIMKSSIGPAIPAMGAASLALFDATSANFSILLKKNTPRRALRAG